MRPQTSTKVFGRMINISGKPKSKKEDTLECGCSLCIVCFRLTCMTFPNREEFFLLKKVICFKISYKCKNFSWYG